jgi:hypothetical protein
MKHTDRLAVVGVAFVALYGAVLAWHGPARTVEVFPFFNWSLFSTVPERVSTDYSIRFIDVGGDALDPPVYFEEARSFLPTSASPGARQVIRELGKAVDEGHPLRLVRNQQILEREYLAALEQADYELVRRRFDIVDRRSCDCFISETVIGTGSVP